MANYTKSTNFAAKDALSPGNAGKIVKGTEIDTEFNNIQTAISTCRNRVLQAASSSVMPQTLRNADFQNFRSRTVLKVPF